MGMRWWRLGPIGGSESAVPRDVSAYAGAGFADAAEWRGVLHCWCWAFPSAVDWGEEAFLSAELGEPYPAYRARVPRVVPALRPRLAASEVRPAWVSAVLGEVYMWGVVACVCDCWVAL